jgi:hypothetical protein
MEKLSVDDIAVLATENPRAMADKIVQAAIEYVEVLQNAVKDYARTGVAFASHDVQQALAWLRYPDSHRRFFEYAAEHLGREQLVYAEQSPWHIRLVVPRNKKMENVVAPLLLIAHQMTSRNPPNNLPAAVCYNDSKAQWRFWFAARLHHDSEGMDRWNDFLELCRTCPVNRIMLKIVD